LPQATKFYMRGNKMNRKEYRVIERLKRIDDMVKKYANYKGCRTIEEYCEIYKEDYNELFIRAESQLNHWLFGQHN